MEQSGQSPNKVLYLNSLTKYDLPLHRQNRSHNCCVFVVIPNDQTKNDDHEDKFWLYFLFNGDDDQVKHEATFANGFGN